MAKNSSYIDVGSLCQVIGCIYNNPKLLERDDKYKFNKEDFVDSFHQMIFSAIYNCWQLGAKELSLSIIEDYLTQRPKALAEYKVNNGAEYLLKVAETANPLTFDYHYARMKKLTLLRAYENMGMDLRWYLDEDNLDFKKLQEQRDTFDADSLEDIANKINDKIDAIKIQYIQSVDGAEAQIGDGIDEFLESLKETPALGYPLYGGYMNSVTRGARLGKFFLRSAATGVGKTRSMIADACFIGCSQMYDLKENRWITIGACQPTLYIATEQDLQEIQSMAVAFLAGVDEDHILKGEYYVGEWERVQKAAQILKQSKIRFVCMPDFSMQDVENMIKKHIREFGVEYVFFDYIHSSAKILMEVGGRSGVKSLREDNVLFLLSSKLKDICVQYGVFILSSTQLNSDYQVSETPDQNLLRGSKAIADRIDWGGMLLEVTKEDKEKLQSFVNKNGLPMPNIKLSIYKNRQGQYKGMYIWMIADRSCCRFDGIFCSNWGYEIMDIADLKIKVQEESVF